jgi:hypothetical protein
MKVLPLSSERFVAAASAFLGLGEERLRGWRGEMVECFLREVRIARAQAGRAAWHTAFIHHAGFWSHFDHDAGRSSWPLPATGNAPALAAYALLRGVLQETPEAGDVFLLWSRARRRYVRTGIVVRVDGNGEGMDGALWHECVTIEANTSQTLAAGGRILRHSRRFVPSLKDRFVRWTALEVRAVLPEVLPLFVPKRRRVA